MNRIDRLYLKAVRLKMSSKKLPCLAFVEEYDGQYKAAVQIWDGKPGSLSEDDIIISWHDTQEKALEAIRKLTDEYSNNEDILVFINDYGDGGV